MSATTADTGSSNTSTFIAALVTAAITVGAFTTVWLVLHGRKNLRQVYQPRTDLAPDGKRPKELPDGVFAFWKQVLSMPDTDLIVANGLDAALFVRFLKVFGIKLLLPYAFLSVVVCIPVAAAPPTAGLQGLNILSFGNVSAAHTERRIAHFLVALILMAWTAYTLYKEYGHFVTLRQAWLTSQQHLALPRSRTIAVTNLPDHYNDEASLKELTQSVSTLVGPSAPRRSTATEGTAFNTSDDNLTGSPEVWLSRKVKEVEDVWEERNQECTRLEGGVGKLLKLANKNQRKGKTPEKKGAFDAERADHPAHRYVLPKKMPSWKQGFLGLIGKKQDLESSPQYIAERNDKLKDLRSKEYDLGNTAFLRFDSQHEAHNFARLAPTTDKKLKLVTSSIELVPEDVEWSNVAMNPYQRKIGKIVSWGLTIGLIIVWAIPVAFVGSVSNIDQLCVKAAWLAWVCRLPAPALGIIRGVLPPALLAILFMLLPVVLRMMVKYQGEIRKSDIELKLFTRYWLFQVVHGFLIITLASGLINALSELGSTAGSVPTLLAEKLPGASIFFLTFILTATFANATKAYARVVPFVMHLLSPILVGATPRKDYMQNYKMTNIKLATVWPPICLIMCITIVYSVIQPIITVLALLAFCILYAAYKYQIGWCCDQLDYLETGGLFYIRALRTVFVALYLEGICLAGLFFLSTDQNGNRAKSGLACGAIIAVMVVAIACLQFYIDWFAFKKPFLHYVHSTQTAKDGRPITEPKLQPTTTNITHTSNPENAEAGAQYGNTTGLHDEAFDHPAMWKKQPVIWIAEDPLGLGRDQADRINAKRVEASTEYAHLGEDGKMSVDRGPPDEAWYGGFSA